MNNASIFKDHGYSLHSPSKYSYSEILIKIVSPKLPTRPGEDAVELFLSKSDMRLISECALFSDDPDLLDRLVDVCNAKEHTMESTSLIQEEQASLPESSTLSSDARISLFYKQVRAQVMAGNESRTTIEEALGILDKIQARYSDVVDDSITTAAASSSSVHTPSIQEQPVGKTSSVPKPGLFFNTGIVPEAKYVRYLITKNIMLDFSGKVSLFGVEGRFYLNRVKIGSFWVDKEMQQQIMSLRNTPEQLISYLKTKGAIASKIAELIDSDLRCATPASQSVISEPGAAAPICSSRDRDRTDVLDTGTPKPGM